MSFDLLTNENATTMLRASRNPSFAPEAGFWTGFLPGAAEHTMEGFAKTARGIDLLGAIGPMVEDRLTGGTAEQDRYFQEHDDVFNHAVDYWTPRPGEVGTAGRLVGSLIPTLAEFAVAPPLAIGSATLGTAEDLVRKGIDADKAVKVGIVQGTGVGLGAYLPIFGQTLATRALVAGAGSNVAQGIAARAASRKILEGTDAAKEFNPWDAESMLIDSFMGLGFGTLHHLASKPDGTRPPPPSPLSDTDKAAILTANQARHLEDTTAPGLPLTDGDRTAHAAAMRKAIDDVLQGRTAEVGQILQDTRLESDPAREAAQSEVRQAVSDEARQVVLDAIAKEQRVAAAEETPGFLRTAEQLLALKREERPDYAPELEAAIAIAKKPGFQRTAEEKIALDTFLRGRGAEVLMRDIPEPPPPPSKAVETAPKGGAEPAKESGAAPAPVDPIVAEAQDRLAADPKLSMTDENGKTVALGDELQAATEARAQAEKDVGVFTAAAQCFLGIL